MSRRLFTSESVTEGHPDKIADQISDTILDALLKEDPTSRVAVETLITTGQVHVAGEVTTKAYADIADAGARQDPGDRLRLVEEGLRRRLLRRLGVHRRAVPGHRAGRRHAYETPGRGRRGRAGPAGRRRPGPDVRLRLRRDARADAAADHAGAPALPAAVRGPQERHHPLPAPRRQDPGHHRVRRRQGRPPRHRRRLLAARLATSTWSRCSPPTSASSSSSRS